MTRVLTAEVLRGKTAPLLLYENARSEPDAIAFRSKHLGIYRERSWRDYAEMVARAADAFADLGLTSGERVAIMGDPCEEWLIADLAAQSLGAIVYGIYPTASVSEVEYLMKDGGATLFIAEDQEYIDKILPIAERLPALKWMVVIDDSAMFNYAHPKLQRYRELIASTPAPDLAAFERRARAIPATAPAFIVYTSGTTGHPKGALVTHGKHLASTSNFLTHYPTLAEKDHRTVIYLPLCHIFGRDAAVTLPLISRVVPHFGEDIEDLPATLFEVAPTVLFAVPRYLQKFAARILVNILGSSAAKRSAYELAMRVARGYLARRWNGEAAFAQGALYQVCHRAVFAPILNKIGFDRLELVICGGAPLPTDTAALWQMYGVNVVEVYGQTEEAGGIISGQSSPFPRPGNVGKPPDGWQVRLDDDGEILVHNPNVFEGYWGNDAETRAVKDADGWIKTGDVGEWRDGALKLVDRVRDFIVTSGGKTLSPSLIENLLRRSPYVAEAVVFGHGRKYLTALIEIDADTVADWARTHNVPYTGFTSLVESPQIVNLIRSEIDRTNGELARVEQIKRFRILPKMLDPEEDGEPITPTRKVKRNLMYDRFRPLVEQMYDDAEERLLATGARGALHV